MMQPKVFDRKDQNRILDIATSLNDSGRVAMEQIYRDRLNTVAKQHLERKLINKVPSQDELN